MEDKFEEDNWENWNYRLKEVKKILLEGETNELSPKELFFEIQEVIPAIIKYRELKPKTPQHQLEYQRQWRKDQKKIAELEAIGNNRRAVIKLKIAKGLERENLFCYDCKKSFKIDPTTNSYKYKSKRKDTKIRLIIMNDCPQCSKKMSGFGGMFLESDRNFLPNPNI